MRLDLTELLAKIGTGLEIDQTQKLKFLAEEVDLASPVRIKLKLLNSGLSVLLDGFFEADVWLDCVRCLKRYKEHLKVPIKEEFSQNIPQLGGKKAEMELTEKDFVYKLEKDNTIDLSEIIRQNLVMALPVKALCSKACKGGEMRDEQKPKKQIDPRLAKLKEFKKN